MFELQALGQQCVNSEAARGNKTEVFRFQGYAGFQSGQARWGWGKDGCICIVSGELANMTATDLAKHSDRWTRVDYCVTVQALPGMIQPDEDYWTAFRMPVGIKGQPAELGRLQKKGGGNTTTLGERASPRYVRVYDKTRESGGVYPPQCWRWEIELKRQEALHELGLWQAGMVLPNRPLNMIASHLQTYGLTVPWKPDAEVKRIPGIYHKRDADRLLGWFERQVAPSVRFVAEARGRDAVLKALDL